MPEPALTHLRVRAGDLSLHAVEAGDGPPVVLLHGFPDSWYVWRLQIPALAAAGFRAMAVDLPGYNESERPAGKAGYRVDALADTMAAFIQEAAEGSVVLVGHDWGGVLAWRLAMARPDLVRRLVILNAPHPRIFPHLLRTTSQILRSWYILFFQLPWLPERLIRAFDFAVLERVLRRGRYGATPVTDDEVTRCKRAIGRPGSVESALAYYRAVRLPEPADPPRGGGAGDVTRAEARSEARSSRIEVPTLVVWGERDGYLDVRNLVGLEARVSELRVERVPGAGHWVQLDAAERVNELLVGFAGGG